MSQQPKARILIVDDELLVHQQLIEILEPLYIIDSVQGYGQVLINDAVEHAKHFRPHVAIVDLSLDPANRSDRGGVKILAQLPSMRCILYSNYVTPEISRLAEKYSAVAVGKEEPPQRLLDIVAEKAKENCAVFRGTVFHRASVPSSEKIVQALGLPKSTPSDIMDDILVQLFPGHRIILETVDESAITPEITNRGHSVVLKVRPDDRVEPLIVKLAPQKNIKEEGENFNKFIDRNLSGQFYAKLQSSPAIFWDAGAVVYSFLSAPKRGISTFRNFYTEHNAQAILKPVFHFFMETWGELYKKESAPLKKTLFYSYNQSWHSRLARRLVKFPNQGKEIHFPELLNSLLNPVSWVLRHKDNSLFPFARKAITHGDLHGDNIFVDDSHAWAIDFERSGWGHIIRDFVELELDIVSRLISLDASPLELFGLFVTLTDPRTSGDKYHLADKYITGEQSKKALEVILGLREIAQQQTGFTDYREYYWGLLLDAVFVATLTPDDTQLSQTPYSEDIQRKRALVYGAVLCTRLENWNEKWPVVNLGKILRGLGRAINLDKPSNKEVIV